MIDVNLSELMKMLDEAGVKNMADLKRRVSDDLRSQTAWHDGYQQGFKYAHSMQRTMEQCEQTLSKIGDFNDRWNDTMKHLKAVEKRLKAFEK